MFAFAGIGRRLVGSHGGSDRLASKLFFDRGGIAVIDLCRQLAAIVSCERKARDACAGILKLHQYKLDAQASAFSRVF